jgi:hypothetical protein
MLSGVASTVVAGESDEDLDISGPPHMLQLPNTVFDEKINQVND